MSYYTAVYKIDEDQHEELWQKHIRPLMRADASAPIRITAVSVAHEMKRVNLIEEALERCDDLYDLRDTIESIIGCANLDEWSFDEPRKEST